MWKIIWTVLVWVIWTVLVWVKENIWDRWLKKDVAERIIKIGEYTLDDVVKKVDHDIDKKIGDKDGSSPSGETLPSKPKVRFKGLLSYDELDADFFPELLPEPRDQDGIPESIRFWKTRIEQTDPEKTFRVGVIYGPSGCGKSSLMNAGILPRLTKQETHSLPTNGTHSEKTAVVPVCVEATAEDTEDQLLRRLRRYCPELPPKSELVLTLREKKDLPAGKKVLIVIDQFEQWLHAKPDYEKTDLVQALKECDGERVQCVLLVRDDFWTPLSRFLKALEVRQEEGRNMALVDRFDLRHAERVLVVFGQSDGMLNSTGQLTGQETAFVQQSITGLAQEGKISCVRLVLFAQMVKDKPWIPATLKSIGGVEKVEVTFLKETFSDRNAREHYRRHEKAAEAILKALLPEQGTDIKGAMKSKHVLLQASGYAHRPDDFVELLDILNSELRLITPTPPPGSEAEEETQAASPELEQYYQLTHDYLVPAVRDWVRLKQTEARRGRAELRLAELSSLWNSKPENRHLPSALEWANIHLLTRKKDWNEPQRRMMRKAGWVYGSRTLAPLVLLGLLTWGSIEVCGTLRASRQVESLWTATSTTDLPGLLQQLDGYRRWAKPVLEAELARKPAPDATADAQDQLAQRQARAAVALLRWGPGEKAWTLLRHSPDPSVRSYIVNWLKPLGAEPKTLITKLEGLAQNPGSIPKDGKSRMDEILFHPVTSERRALILALGGYEAYDLSPTEREPLMAQLLEAYRTDPDAGVHGAAEWTLRRWKQEETLKKVDAELQRLKDRGNRRWYVNSEGQTLAVIEGPVEFSMGSPLSEPDQDPGETPHRQRINRRFAIATKEVTVEQYQRFLKENPKIARLEIDRYSPEPTGPMNTTTWYEAAAYCNWLSEQEHLKPCYEPISEGEYAEGMKILPDALKLPGYRLPTDAEWEYACRAGAVTSRYYGRSVELLGKYAWYSKNSQDRAWPWPCGQLLPNELGLFDMLGNVYEWCQEQYYRYPEGEGNTTIDDMNILLSINEKNPCLCRGGSFSNRPESVRSAYRVLHPPSFRNPSYGFRPSRTYH
jgi:formylglycine-generating enzyme required for sulfatase activity